MRCKPCGAPRNPNADRCDYCQSWHEARPVKMYDYGRMTAPQHQQSLANIQAQMMAQDSSYQLRRYQLAGMANAYGGASGFGGLLGMFGRTI